MKRPSLAAVAVIIVGAIAAALLVLPRHDSSQALTAARIASAPVTATELLSAPVPSSCNHPAGTLANGRLPGIAPFSGHVQLAWLDDPSSLPNRLAFGDLNADGGEDAAAVLDCTAGMGAWPQIIAFYTAGPKLLGSVNLSTVNLPGHVPGQSDFVNKVRFDHGGIEVRWKTQQDGDPVAIPTLAYSATLRWNGRSIVSSNLTATTEVDTVVHFVDDLQRGNTLGAVALAAPGVGAKAAKQFRLYPSALTSAPSCHGLIDQNIPESVKALVDPGTSTGFPHADRICLVPTADHRVKDVVLGMRSAGFRQWQVAWIRVA